MKLFEVKDIVREQVGRDKLSDPALDWCVQRALREIEKRDNFYWMDATSPLFNVYEDQQDYEIEAADGLNISDLKDFESIMVSDRTPTDPIWDPVEGPQLATSMKGSFTEADSGKPAFWTRTETTLSFWPPSPQQDYLGIAYYWKWTTLPIASTSDEHEVLRRWPEALIYLATEQGIIISSKDMEQAAYWHGLFENIGNPMAPSEYKKIRLYQQSRKNPKRFRDAVSNNGSSDADRNLSKVRGWF